jgi:uridylate kinase
VSHKRVLLKISGEQVAGKFDSGVDPDYVHWLAEEVKSVGHNVQIVIVVGGGNMVRGADIAGHGIKRVTGDHMGMLSGLINSMAITDIFEDCGISTRCLSNIFADQVAEMYSYRRADKHLKNGRVIIIAGGLGRPYFTHDTAAVNLALELNCEVVLKATKVDGVYDKDPAKHSDAKKFEKLDFQSAVENSNVKVMDKAALGLAMEHKLPIVVFDAVKKGNVSAAARGQAVGTKIS